MSVTAIAAKNEDREEDAEPNDGEDYRQADGEIPNEV